MSLVLHETSFIRFIFMICICRSINYLLFSNQLLADQLIIIFIPIDWSYYNYSKFNHCWIFICILGLQYILIFISQLSQLTVNAPDCLNRLQNIYSFSFKLELTISWLNLQSASISLLSKPQICSIYNFMILDFLFDCSFFISWLTHSF